MAYPMAYRWSNFKTIGPNVERFAAMLAVHFFLANDERFTAMRAKYFFLNLTTGRPQGRPWPTPRFVHTPFLTVYIVYSKHTIAT